MSHYYYFSDAGLRVPTAAAAAFTTSLIASSSSAISAWHSAVTELSGP